MGIFSRDSEKKKENGMGFQAPAVAGDMAALAKEEMNGLPMKFDQAKVSVPAANDELVGAAAASVEEHVFEVVEGDTGELSWRNELVGVIVDKHPMNIYYVDKYHGTNSVPNCCSIDGVTGVGDPGGSCVDCPMNRFGSGVDKYGNLTNAKACQNKYWIYLYQEGLAPMRIQLPVTSRKNFEGYLTKHIVAQGRRSSGVVTRITLRQTKSKEGFMYGETLFAVDSVLDEATAARMADYSDKIKDLTRRMTICEKGDISVM